MLVGFDHVNIRTSRLDEMVAWYGEILGLKPGWRPDFAFPGAWLYLGDVAYVHLIGEDRARRPEDLTLEHFAFRGEGMATFMAKLEQRGIAAELFEVTDASVVQVNIRDPEGIHIHIDFALAEYR